MTRRDDPNKPRERSTLAKVFRVAAPVAIGAGALAKWHMSRPRGPIPATNPADLVPHIGGTGPLQARGSGDFTTYVDTEGKEMAKSIFHGSERAAEHRAKATPTLIEKATVLAGKLDAKAAERKALSDAAKAIREQRKPAPVPKPADDKSLVGTPPPPPPHLKTADGPAVNTNVIPGVGTASDRPVRRIISDAPKPEVPCQSETTTDGTRDGANKSFRLGASKTPRLSMPRVSRTSVAAAEKNAANITSGRLSYDDFVATTHADNKRRAENGLPLYRIPTPDDHAKPGYKRVIDEATITPEHKAAVEDAAKKAARARKDALLRKSKLVKHSPVKKKPEEKKELASVLRRYVMFNERDAATGIYGASDKFATQYRRARRLMPWVNRGQSAAEDIGDIASGREVKDPFYKKGWFKYGAAAAAAATPFAAVRRWNKLAVQDATFPNSIAAMHPLTGRVQERFLKAGRSLDSWMVKRKLTKAPVLTDPTKAPLFASKLQEIRMVRLRSRVRAIMFDMQSEDRGWDLRDARGRSARVYAPGSRRRERRQKDWSEKTDNIRAVRNAAIGAAVLGAAGTGVLGRKLYIARQETKTAADVAAKRVAAVSAASSAEAERLASARLDQRIAEVRHADRLKHQSELKLVARQASKKAREDAVRKQALSSFRNLPGATMTAVPSISDPLPPSQRRIHASARLARLRHFNSLHKVIDSGVENVELPESDTVSVIKATLDDHDRRRWALRGTGATALLGGGALAGYHGGRAAYNKVSRLTASAKQKFPRWGLAAGATVGGLGALGLLR